MTSKRIKADTVKPFLSALIFIALCCSSDKNVDNLTVCAFAFGDNLKTPFPLYLYYILVTCVCKVHLKNN